jgi:hypothetical protein
MAGRDKLLNKARTSPGNLRFEEICQLAEEYGFEFKRQGGSSHRIYKHPNVFKLMNFQNVNGMAKAYQVKQLLNAIDNLPDVEEETN